MLDSGTRLGSYEILAGIGTGGMGEVYRAKDTKLGREIALKVLPLSFTSDPERVARFRREAQVLASLNHPHIAQIHGLEEVEGTQFLVLELVDGESLDKRIARGRIPVDEALGIAKQIAEGLEAAHEKGIIHRDLKPANVALTRDGQVKVLDFGLAKAVEATAPVCDLSMSPTITSPAMMTGVGVILGTAAYMAPEQAKGRAADKRSDIWAFGCVLYEMLTGKRAFAGDDVSDTLANVLRTPPDWTALPQGTPVPIRRLLRRCLAKDLNARIGDASTARIEIDEAQSGPDVGGEIVYDAGRRRERIVWASLVAIVILAAGGIFVWLRDSASSRASLPEMRLEITTPPRHDPGSFAISPDGRRLVFAATADGHSSLWLRAIDTLAAERLAGTEGAIHPFWSPDSRSLGFFASGKLKRLDLGAGTPQTLADAPAGLGGTWNRAGVILFSSRTGTPLLRMPASGGDAIAATRIAPAQVAHQWPQFLPDGRRFLFVAGGSADISGTYLGSLDTPETKRLVERPATYAEPGWLLMVRDGTLVARRFDPGRAELVDDPASIGSPVGAEIGPGQPRGMFSISQTGLLAYSAAAATVTQLTWFDRSGTRLGTLGPRDANALLDPALAPDGHRVAVRRTVDGNTDIWLIDDARMTRFTFDPSLEQAPTWSPDGTRIVFSSNRKGRLDLYQKRSNGAGSEEPLLETPLAKGPSAWSPDGRFLLYQTQGLKTGLDIWVLPLDGERKPFVFVQSSSTERYGQFSPDGRWVAYQSDESGQYDIYVRPFTGADGAANPGAQWQVSTTGGISPRWRRDGKELYYIAPDGTLMAATVTSTGTAFEAGPPSALFQTRIVYGGASPPAVRPEYDVAPDGRFLINSVAEETTSPIIVIQNWMARFRQ
jgi:Tol biopolymer transport system component